MNPEIKHHYEQSMGAIDMCKQSAIASHRFSYLTKALRERVDNTSYVRRLIETQNVERHHVQGVGVQIIPFQPSR